jgi:hypothetical protein
MTTTLPLLSAEKPRAKAGTALLIWMKKLGGGDIPRGLSLATVR